MNIYGMISKAYDLLDIMYFNEKGKTQDRLLWT